LARWKDLIELMKKNHLEDDDLLVGLQVAGKKSDLLEFWLALERRSGLPILNNLELAQALRHDSVARQEWALDAVQDKELSPYNAQVAMEDLMSSNTSTMAPRALEVVCTHLAQRVSRKPPGPRVATVMTEATRFRIVWNDGTGSHGLDLVGRPWV
jgi:hypothetical protein